MTKHTEYQGHVCVGLQPLRCNSLSSEFSQLGQGYCIWHLCVTTIVSRVRLRTETVMIVMCINSCLAKLGLGLYPAVLILRALFGQSRIIHVLLGYLIAPMIQYVCLSLDRLGRSMIQVI
jgi:hypothetical protein